MMYNYQNHPLAGASDLDSAMTRLWDFYKHYFVRHVYYLVHARTHFGCLQRQS